MKPCGEKLHMKSMIQRPDRKKYHFEDRPAFNWDVQNPRGQNKWKETSFIGLNNWYNIWVSFGKSQSSCCKAPGDTNPLTFPYYQAACVPSPEKHCDRPARREASRIEAGQAHNASSIHMLYQRTLGVCVSNSRLSIKCNVHADIIPSSTRAQIVF